MCCRLRHIIYGEGQKEQYLFMVALCNRETIYIFMLWFVLLSSSSFMVALWNRETIYIFMLWFVYGRPM